MKNVLPWIVEKFFFLSSLLPMWVHYLLADLIYLVLYYIVRYRRRVVERNIARSFPEKSDAERAKIVRGFYRFFGDYVVETCKLLTIKEENIRRRMVFTNPEVIEAALQDHDQVFFYLGHYCNWEWISTFPLWTSAHCGQLYKPLSNEGFSRVFNRLRTRFGAENIDKNKAFRRILALKQEGTKSIIGMIADQSPRPQNIHDWVTFLNQDTPVFTGAERIARKVGAALFYCDVERVRRGYYRCTFRTITLDINALPDYKPTELYMNMLEQNIRRQPPFYLWSHKRWKHTRESVAQALKNQ